MDFFFKFGFLMKILRKCDKTFDRRQTGLSDNLEGSYENMAFLQPSSNKERHHPTMTIALSFGQLVLRMRGQT